MAPPSNMMRILGEGEASLLEEAARQSHHDFVVGVKSYVRLLPSEEIYDRMMNASTLVSLPRSLKWQITRYNRALANHDALSLKKERDERHRLIVDRRRLQDEYQALRRLEECVIELQRDEQLHSSILVTLNVQLDLLVPDFSTLNNLLKTKEVVETLKCVYLSSLHFNKELTSNPVRPFPFSPPHKCHFVFHILTAHLAHTAISTKNGSTSKNRNTTGAHPASNSSSSTASQTSHSCSWSSGAQALQTPGLLASFTTTRAPKCPP